MEEREVELIDYLVVLWRWKWLIVVGTVACLLAAVVATWTLAQLYRVSATIDTGDLSEERAKDVERLVARLNAVGMAPEDRALMSQAAPAAVTAEFKRPAIIELGLDTASPAGAGRALAGTANKMVDELNQLLEVQERQYTRARQRADELRRDLEQLRQARAVALRRAEDPAGALVFAHLVDAIMASERSLLELERQLLLLPQGGRRARLLIAPEVPRLSNRSRLRVYLAGTFVAGFMGSVMLAFFVDYVRQARRRRRGST